MNTPLRFNRRSVMITSAAALACIGIGTSHAQTGPIKLIVQFAPGGNVDTFARVLAQQLTTSLGVNVVVENRPGGNGTIAYQALARSAPDGTTLGIGHIAHLAINPHLFDKLGYRPLQDFVPISLLAEAPNVLAVHPSIKVNSLQALIERARQRPGSLSFGHGGAGTVAHLTGEVLARSKGIEILQVPYKGSGQVVTDLVAGQINVAFGGLPSLMPHVEAGRLQALAVTGSRRLSSYPQIPTLMEQEFNFAATAWMGLIGPAGIPAPIVRRLEAVSLDAMNAPDVRSTLLDKQGMEVTRGSAEAFREFIQKELVSWGKFIKDAGIKGA